MPLYTNLSLFLIISSKNYISHPKSLMESAVAMVFRRKVSQGSRFKKTFLLPCYDVVVLLHKLPSLIRRHCHTELVDIMVLNCHYYQR